MRMVSMIPLVAVATSVAFCGFRPRPTSGMVACVPGGAACCPDNYVCVGRGAITAEGSTDGTGTCWSKADLPPEALSAAHDYTQNVLSDPACLVTDWLPPGMGWPDAGDLGGGGRIIGGGAGGAISDGGSVMVTPAVSTGTIFAGNHRTYFVRGNGLWAWGNNTNGWLGDGTTIDRWHPELVPNMEAGVATVSTRGGHTCAVVNGGVYCWGHNEYGQLGNNTTSDSMVPVPVVGLGEGATAVAVGDDHTCAAVNGGVWCWGRSDYALSLLGDGSTAVSLIPLKVPDLPSGVTALAAGLHHTCAVVDGGVRCWGRNPEGELGDSTTTDRPTPVAVVGLEAGVTAIAAGDDHNCAIVQTGGLRCWGNNSYGALGNGKAIRTLDLVQVKGLPVPVVDVTCGGSITCAIVQTGKLFCWGSNHCFQIGDPILDSSDYAATPFQVPGFKFDVQDIAVGSCHSCAFAGGGVECWGYNDYGERGVEGRWGTKTPVDVQLP